MTDKFYGRSSAYQIPDLFEPGRLVQGRYELLSLIGDGAVGTVMAARHLEFDDLVAIKFLKPEYANNTEAATRFAIEARTNFKLRSEHIVRVLDVGIYAGSPFIVMEHLEGADLRSLAHTLLMPEIPRVVDWALQVCDALSYAHTSGVIHRDIKPENLFVCGGRTDQEHVKVLDFGISKVASVRQILTQTAVGTPPYMSPEQLRAKRDLDGRADIWSLGCVLYELLTGSSPFDRGNVMLSCAAVLERDPQPVDHIRPAVPSELSQVVARCLRKDRNERFNEVAALAEALSPFGSGKYSAYPARCRANLNDEKLKHRLAPQNQLIEHTATGQQQPTVSSVHPVMRTSSSRLTSGSTPRQTGHLPPNVLDASPMRLAILVAGILAVAAVIGIAAGLAYPHIQPWFPQLANLTSVLRLD